MNSRFYYKDIKSLLPEHSIFGDVEGAFFSNISNLENAESDSLIFFSKKNEKLEEVLLATQASVIILSKKWLNMDNFSGSKLYIFVDDPKIAFSLIGNHLFVPKISYGIHPSSVIHNEAQIEENVYIGPNCVIGKGIIKSGSVIYGNVFIYDNFFIGNNVMINAGCVIGAEGFGYNKDENGLIIQFPHIGGVVIENNVEIGSNTCIDRGALSNTILKEGCKIDNLVHIAHNVIVGKNSYVIANSMVGGSTVIEDDVYVAPSVSLRDRIVIGSKSLIGMGASVLKSVPSEEIWTGSPAKNIEEIKALNKKLSKLE